MSQCGPTVLTFIVNTNIAFNQDKYCYILLHVNELSFVMDRGGGQGVDWRGRRAIYIWGKVAKS